MKAVKLIMIGTALLLAGCDTWPPEENRLRDNFSSNREAFDAIRHKISDTDYLRVSLTAVPTETGPASATTVLAKLAGDEFPEEVYISDDREWNDFLLSTGAFSIAQYGNIVELDFGNALEHERTHLKAKYVHDEDGKSWRKSCLPDHKVLRCGQCAVELEDNWFIEYYWSPSSELLVPSAAFELLDDTYEETVNWELTRCEIEGYTAIGYSEEILNRVRERHRN